MRSMPFAQVRPAHARRVLPPVCVPEQCRRGQGGGLYRRGCSSSRGGDRRDPCHRRRTDGIQSRLAVTHGLVGAGSARQPAAVESAASRGGRPFHGGPALPAAERWLAAGTGLRTDRACGRVRRANEPARHHSRPARGTDRPQSPARRAGTVCVRHRRPKRVPVAGCARGRPDLAARRLDPDLQRGHRLARAQLGPESLPSQGGLGTLHRTDPLRLRRLRRHGLGTLCRARPQQPAAQGGLCLRPADQAQFWHAADVLSGSEPRGVRQQRWPKQQSRPDPSLGDQRRRSGGGSAARTSPRHRGAGSRWPHAPRGQGGVQLLADHGPGLG